MGTDPVDRCADDTVSNNERGPAYGQPLSPWPPDINDDRLVNLQDVGAYNQGAFGKAPPDPLYNRRLDMNTSDLINLQDTGVFNVTFGHLCTP